MAILGSKGSGKRALLDVIAKRAEGRGRGTVLLNGAPLSKNLFHQRCAYVTVSCSIQPNFLESYKLLILASSWLHSRLISFADFALHANNPQRIFEDIKSSANSCRLGTHSSVEQESWELEHEWTSTFVDWNSIGSWSGHALVGWTDSRAGSACCVPFDINFVEHCKENWMWSSFELGKATVGCVSFPGSVCL